MSVPKLSPCLQCGGQIKQQNRGGLLPDLTCTGECGSYWGEWDPEEWNGQWAHKEIERLKALASVPKTKALFNAMVKMSSFLKALCFDARVPSQTKLNAREIYLDTRSEMERFWEVDAR